MLIKLNLKKKESISCKGCFFLEEEYKICYREKSKRTCSINGVFRIYELILKKF